MHNTPCLSTINSSKQQRGHSPVIIKFPDFSRFSRFFLGEWPSWNKLHGYRILRPFDGWKDTVNKLRREIISDEREWGVRPWKSGRCRECHGKVAAAVAAVSATTDDLHERHSASHAVPADGNTSSQTCRSRRRSCRSCCRRWLSSLRRCSPASSASQLTVRLNNNNNNNLNIGQHSHVTHSVLYSHQVYNATTNV